MNFSQLKTEIKNVAFETVRTDAEDYFEAVITKEKLTELSFTLEKGFGVPAWPSKNRLAAQIQKAIAEFGGIRDGQTLYFGNEDKYSLFAMLWPWQDAEHITLKIAKK
jgi:hypothetical protein